MENANPVELRKKINELELRLREKQPVKLATPAWLALTALLTLVALSGCRALPTPPVPPPTAIASAAEVLARLQNRAEYHPVFSSPGPHHGSLPGTELLRHRLD